MLIINNVKVPITADFLDIKTTLAKAVGVDIQSIKSAQLYRRSLDARKRDNIFYCCTFLVDLTNNNEFLRKNKNAQIYEPQKYIWQKVNSNVRPVVVGFGPAGMFAALTLARAGLHPIVYERGDEIKNRQKDVQTFLAGGKLNTNSNVQFGEGGAGAFSDGKLNTGIKDLRCRTVLKLFNEFGGREDILYQAKPHIGTDVLVSVVENIRNEIISLGGEIHFNSRVDDIIIEKNTIKGLKVTSKDNTQTIYADYIVFAIGHSARDTFDMLLQRGVNMERKPFSVGLRIEHRQADVNRALYGDFADLLPAADYKMAAHLPSGRGVYTFCMCPGGEVVNASSEKDGIAVNGMSYSARDGENANSAVLVEVREEDLPNDTLLAGIEFQRNIEKAAYNIAKGKVPICYLANWLSLKSNKKVNPTIKPDYVETSPENVLPNFVTESIKEALPLFDKKIKGFLVGDALLTFPETRSTSPIRIKRDDKFVSVNTKGLYPAGEGAGYAGGIMSSAVDGIKIAEAIISDINNL